MSTILYTVPEAMEKLRIGRTLIYRLIRAGELQSVLIGGARRIPAAALDTYVSSLLPDSGNRTFRYVTQAGE